MFIALVQKTACNPMKIRKRLPSSMMDPCASVSTTAIKSIKDPNVVSWPSLMSKKHSGRGIYMAVLPE